MTISSARLSKNEKIDYDILTSLRRTLFERLRTVKLKNAILILLAVCLIGTVTSMPARADIIDDALAAHDKALQAMTDASIAKANAQNRCAAQVPPVNHLLVPNYVAGGMYQTEGNADWVAAEFLLVRGHIASSITYYKKAKVHFAAAKVAFDSIFPVSVDPPDPPM